LVSAETIAQQNAGDDDLPRAPITFASPPQDFRDVCVKTLPSCGRSPVSPQCGQAAPPWSCWLMLMEIVTSRWHFWQKYS
jgi:hypothetical protein